MKTLLRLSVLCLLSSVLFACVAHAASVTCSWQDNSANEDGFTVERAPGLNVAPTATTWQVIANRKSSAAETTGAGPAARRAHVDSTAAAGTAYSYRVRGYNAGGPGDYGPIVSITTAAAMPPPPAAPSAPEATSPKPDVYTPPEPVVTLNAGESLRVVAALTLTES